MNIKPIEDRVVLEIKKDEEKNIGGIIIPDTAKEKPQIGKVLAVGTDPSLQSLIQVGNEVIYSKYSGTEIEISNKKYLIVSKNDILAIIE